MVDRMAGVESSLGGQLDGLKEKALDMSATARERLSGGGMLVREYIVKEPTKALAVAVGVGVILGWLIKRR